MKIYHRCDFDNLLMNEGFLEKFIDFGFCSKHQNSNYIRVRDVVMVLTGSLDPTSKNMHDLIRDIFNKRGWKGKNVFTTNEQVTWCGCEPQCSEFRAFTTEFYDKLCNMHEFKCAAGDT